MEHVRRDDGELCGHVAPAGDGWTALTVFGAVLGDHSDREEAVQHVLDEGLSSLAERWTLHDGHSEHGDVICIVEARPDSVSVVLGHYTMAGAPTTTITASDLASGRWVLRRRRE